MDYTPATPYEDMITETDVTDSIPQSTLGKLERSLRGTRAKTPSFKNTDTIYSLN